MKRSVIALSAGLLLVLTLALAAAFRLHRERSAGNDGVSSRVAVDETEGTRARFGIIGTVGYEVRDARGAVKVAGVIHNTVNNEAKNEVFNRITTADPTVPYDGIAALDVSVGSDDPVNGVLAGSIALDLDGDGATAGNQNPADGAVATDFGTDPGMGTVTVMFTALADSITVKQIVLTKADEDDTVVSNGLAIPDVDVFAYVDVPDVTLNTGDTVQYTWTVNVD